MNAMQSASILPKPSGTTVKPGQNQGGKASFVICEICDGWIKDLDQLRNHMQWMHKVKVRSKEEKRTEIIANQIIYLFLNSK